MLTQEYIIKTGEFEGPLDLLLTLIEKRKLFINDFSLAKVSEDYFAYLNKHNNDMKMLAGFIVVASTLILIKSRSLLPNLILSEEEESEIIDLKDRLALYKQYVKLSENIRRIFGKKIIFSPQKEFLKIIFVPDEKITKDNLCNLMKNLLQNMPKFEKLPVAIVKKVINLEEMINRLKTRVEQSINSQITFNDFTAQTREEKVLVIVSFLALLELIRQGILDAKQEEASDIKIYSV